ncbi:MAG: ankyrin repeat domain-containing protein [Treponema sp.]|nr:ankyrin repeat domain-containing protein [Candidatus Treponema equi]
MKKYIVFCIIALSAVFSLAAKKDPVDYDQLAAKGTQNDIKKVYSRERGLFDKKYYDAKETFLDLCLKHDREFSIIKLCISYESDVNAKTKDGRTPMMYAAEYSSDPSAVELIIKQDALTSGKRSKRILQQDKDGHDSFYYAKKNSTAAIYTKLCEYAKDPNPSTETAREPEPVQPEQPLDDIAAVEAELAAEAAALEAMTIREPVAAVVAVPIPEPEESEPVEEVPEVTEEPEVVAIVEELPPEPLPDLKKQEVEAYASTFLYDYAEEPAVEEKNEKITLVENPNLTDKNGVSLLMRAAKSGSDWDVRTLLASGADVNMRDKDGWTALMYACRYQNNLNIVNMLIEKGAHVRVRNKFNATPLLMAADYSKNPEIIALLLKNRSASEDEVFRAFIFSITGKASSNHVREAKVKLFLDMKVPLNRLWKGQTPLMYAAQYGTSTEVIKQLLDAGADPELLSDKGKSAFDYAKNNKRLPHDDTYWSLNGTGQAK